MFGSNVHLGKAVTAPPQKLFAVLSLSSLILFLPSILLGIGSIKVGVVGHDGFPTIVRNVGFLHSVWLVAYLVALPLLFSLFAALSSMICSRFEKILEDKVIWKNTTGDSNVLQTRDALEDQPPTPSTVFFTDLTQRMERGATIIPWLSLLFTLLFIANDTAHLPRAVYFLSRSAGYQSSHSRPYEILDWTFAYAIPEHSGEMRPLQPDWKPPSRPTNLAFDILAWTFEGIYVFLGFLWVFTYGWFLKVVADLLIDKENNYDFYPMTRFDDLRLGLHPLGTLYNLYLSAVVVFGMIGVWLRIKYIAINCKADFPTAGSYLKTLVNTTRQQVTSRHIAIPDTRLLGFKCLNQAHLWFICGYALCIFVIVYFPILRLKRYIKDRIFLIKRLKHDELRQAIFRGDKTTETFIMKEISDLQRAQVWPNGDNAGISFLATVSILFIAIVSPALIGFAIVGVAITGFWKLIPKMFGRSSGVKNEGT